MVVKQQKQVNIITNFITKGLAKLNASVGQYEKNLSKVDRTQKRFKAEFLSIMFAGLAISRIFGGIVGEMFSMFGISELLTAFFMTSLIPALETLSGALDPILAWFLDLPEPVQTSIGWFILFVTVVGILLFIVGSAALAFSGFNILLAGLGITFGGFLGILGIVGLVIVGLGLIIYGVILIFKNWGEDVGKVVKGIGFVLIGLGVILFLFIGWWALIPIAVGIVIVLIGQHWDKFKGFIITLWEGIKTTFYKVFVDPILEAINLVKQLVEAFRKLKSGDFSGALGNLKGAGKSLFGSLPGFAEGGTVPGPIGEPRPIIAHGGETVLPTRNGNGGMGEVNISQNINVTVSDRREFEAIIRENNIRLTEDIRRLSQR